MIFKLRITTFYRLQLGFMSLYIFKKYLFISCLWKYNSSLFKSISLLVISFSFDTNSKTRNSSFIALGTVYRRFFVWHRIYLLNLTKLKFILVFNVVTFNVTNAYHNQIWHCTYQIHPQDQHLHFFNKNKIKTCPVRSNMLTRTQKLSRGHFSILS